MDDNTRSDILVDNVPPVDGPQNWLQQAIQAITNLILPTQRELITFLRTPTPVKVSKTFTVDAGGTIGGGINATFPLTLYTCPMSAEAYLHRISVTAPGYGPAAPLTAGEIVCTGSTSGEVIFFLPISGDIAPVQIVEGRLSAPHLNAGETAGILGDGLPAGITIRVDLQILLTTGISEYTPKTTSQLDRL